MVAVLTLAEFSNWKIKNQRGLIYATFVLLLVLVTVHLAAFFGITSISDQEVKNLFIEGGAPYAVLSIVVVGLFFVLRRIGRAS
jgi:heme/copper-type cytochrome/quinol oxidase subunit 4